MISARASRAIHAPPKIPSPNPFSASMHPTIHQPHSTKHPNFTNNTPKTTNTLSPPQQTLLNHHPNPLSYTALCKTIQCLHFQLKTIAPKDLAKILPANPISCFLIINPNQPTFSLKETIYLCLYLWMWNHLPISMDGSTWNYLHMYRLHFHFISFIYLRFISNTIKGTIIYIGNKWICNCMHASYFID